MRKARKLIGILLTMAMVMSLSPAAFAASSPETTGTIIINNAEIGETYSIYQIFDLTYADDASSYSYKVIGSWSDFIEDYTYTNSNGETVSLFDLDDNGYLKVDSNIFNEDDNSEVMSAFAKSALAYATDNNVSPTYTTDAVSNTVTFSNLYLGYYLVSTTLGSLCFLDSTDPLANIEEKNPTPYPDKEEYDSETDEEYTKEDTAEVGDTISYKIFLYDVAHSVNLCMHDSMTDGLTFSTGSVKVYVGYPSADIEDLFNDNTTEWTELDETDDTYTESDSCGDGCAFELSFSDEWLDALASNAVIMVTYDAIVNENAIDENNLWAIQHNDVVLTYGSFGTSTHAETSTETTGFNILKYTEDDEEIVPLDGAEFSLYRDAEHTDIVYFIPISQNGSIVGYEEVDPSDFTGTGTPTTTIVAGRVYVKGLHAGTYYLEETKAPDGYNKLTSDVVITITLSENEEEGETVYVDGNETDDQTAMIENNQGSVLPGTGGIGTTIFYVIGVILVLGAAVLLITKRRMNSAQ